MKITAEMTPREWAQERDMLRAHLEEWLDHEPRIAKSEANATPHPFRAIDDVRRLLRDAYETTLKQMNNDIIQYLHEQVGREPI